MSATARSIRPLARVVGLLWLVVAVAIVAGGCGSSAATAPTTSATTVPAPQPTICSDGQRATSLVVQREDPLAQLHTAYTFAATVTVNQPARVMAAASTLCSLPDAHSSGTFCPANVGVSYQLHFDQPGIALRIVTVSPIGCADVIGLGPVARSSTAHMWLVLAQAIGLPTGNRLTFAGNPPQ